MFFITISPAHRRGERIPGQFVASLDGRQICLSPEPLLASARVLLAEGADPGPGLRSATPAPIPMPSFRRSASPRH